MTTNDVIDTQTTEAVVAETGATDTTVAPPPPPTPSPTLIPDPAVRVRIVPENGSVTINCQLNGQACDIPNNAAILQALPKDIQKQVRPNLSGRRYPYRLLQIIVHFRETIPFRVWADAIGKAIWQQRQNQEPAEYISKDFDTGAYLALGNSVYKLSPVALIPANRALAVARRKALDTTNQITERLLQEAQATANGLIENANRQRQRAQELLTSVQGTAPVPEFARNSGLICRYNRGFSRWCIRADLSLALKGFDYKFSIRQVGQTTSSSFTYSWQAASALPAVDLSLWIPIHHDGSYSPTAIHAVDKVHPHISTTQACLALGDAPNTITSLDDWRRLCDSLSRTLSRIQLDSLLTSYRSWGSTFAHFIPADLHDLLANNNLYDTIRRRFAENPADFQPYQEETPWTTQT